MEFISMRDFRTETTKVWDKLNNDEEIVITNNGRPRAFLVSIPEGYFDEILTGIRQTKAQIKPRNARQCFLQKHTPAERAAAMQEIRELLSDIDGDGIYLKQIRSERRAVKYEYND